MPSTTLATVLLLLLLSDSDALVKHGWSKHSIDGLSRQELRSITSSYRQLTGTKPSDTSNPFDKYLADDYFGKEKIASLYKNITKVSKSAEAKVIMHESTKAWLEARLNAAIGVTSDAVSMKGILGLHGLYKGSNDRVVLPRTIEHLQYVNIDGNQVNFVNSLNNIELSDERPMVVLTKSEAGLTQQEETCDLGIVYKVQQDGGNNAVRIVFIDSISGVTHEIPNKDSIKAFQPLKSAQVTKKLSRDLVRNGLKLSAVGKRFADLKYSIYAFSLRDCEALYVDMPHNVIHGNNVAARQFFGPMLQVYSQAYTFLTK